MAKNISIDIMQIKIIIIPKNEHCFTDINYKDCGSTGHLNC